MQDSFNLKQGGSDRYVPDPKLFEVTESPSFDFSGHWIRSGKQVYTVKYICAT